MAEVTYTRTPHNSVFGDRRVLLTNVTGASLDTITLNWQGIDLVVPEVGGGITAYSVALTYTNNIPKSVITLTGAASASDIMIIGY